ncbi:MAG: pyridoxal phosphate-dependent aminotransferase [Victivallaceae bacterium]|nr:pyridoxal phosphate-dependent aminotransferase [Victivallaceae bacterium]
MAVLSNYVDGCLGRASLIRKMFEVGIEMKKKFGADNVFDFSLGNPDLPSPPEVAAALRRIADDAISPLALGYMQNAGCPEVRARLARKISEEQGVATEASHVILTCGAAGGLNVFLKTVCDPGAEVVVPNPYFAEYFFYVANASAKIVPVQAKDPDFELDVPAMERAFNENTRAVIINTPNNPTGRIYTRRELEDLAAAVRRAEAKFGHEIFVISDEPYRILNFDNLEIPSIFEIFDSGIVIGSFSKSLSLAGERIGYIAVSSKIADSGHLMDGLIFSNRTLGFVNAPAVGQKLLLDCLDAKVDLDTYRCRRDAMAEVLSGAGIEFFRPQGAFYVFAKSPVEDEFVFTEALTAERVLAVPGRGFGRPGFVRFAFCMSEKIIRGAAPRLVAAMEHFR